MTSFVSSAVVGALKDTFDAALNRRARLTEWQCVERAWQFSGGGGASSAVAFLLSTSRICTESLPDL